MKFAFSLILSSAAHLCVFGVIAFMFTSLPDANDMDSLASIDVSSLSLSFAVEEDISGQCAAQERESNQSSFQTPDRPEHQPAPEFEQLPFGEIPVANGVEVKPVENVASFDNANDSLLEEPPSSSEAQEASSPSEKAPVQAQIDALPRLEKNIVPRYPRSSKRNSEQGDVVLSINVGADGTVTSADIAKSSGYAALDEESLRAVMKAKFTPALSGSKRVSCNVSLTIKFRLKEEL